MPGPLIHLGALVACPHAGAVQPAVTTPARVFVNGAQQVLALPDLHAVVGCPFQVPAGPTTKPQPCVQVRLDTAQRVFVNGSPALILTPAAMCFSIEQIAQGPPNSSPVQQRVFAT